MSNIIQIRASWDSGRPANNEDPLFRRDMDELKSVIIQVDNKKNYLDKVNTFSSFLSCWFCVGRKHPMGYLTLEVHNKIIQLAKGGVWFNEHLQYYFGESLETYVDISLRQREVPLGIVFDKDRKSMLKRRLIAENLMMVCNLNYRS